MGLFQAKDRHEFRPLLVEIDERPLNPLGRTLLWILISVLFFGALWLYFAKIDVVVSARGKIIPSGEIKLIQPIETGVISKILVHEGEYVSKGQVLVEIDPRVTESDLASKQRRFSVLSLEILRLRALIDNVPFSIPPEYAGNSAALTQMKLYQSEKRSFEEQIASLEKQLLQLNEQYNAAVVDKLRLQSLGDHAHRQSERLSKVLDIIAVSEYEESLKTEEDYRKQAAMKEHEISQLTAKKEELQKQKSFTRQKFYSRLLEELTQKNKEAAELQAQIEAIKFKSSKQSLCSPVDGYVGKLMVHTVGGVVTPAEKLISIIPKEAPLIVKATVLNQDIGFIKNEMHAAIKIDTYDFQKYGLIDGIVTHISDDAIEDEKMGPVYEVYISLEKNHLIHNGEKLRLHAGMSVTAELKVGKRRVIEFFIYPLIKYLDEGMSVR